MYNFTMIIEQRRDRPYHPCKRNTNKYLNPRTAVSKLDNVPVILPKCKLQDKQNVAMGKFQDLDICTLHQLAHDTRRKYTTLYLH
jgi:hypothetical protein